MIDKTERLLDSEQVLNDLVKELDLLKNEVEGFRDAKVTLNQTGQGLTNAASSLQALSGRVESVSNALREIGTPELLQMQEKLADSQESRFELLDKAVEALNIEMSLKMKKLQSRMFRGNFFIVLMLLLVLGGIGVLLKPVVTQFFQ